MANEGLAAGTVLQDTYRIVRQIGRGGMGAVYEATHARLAGRYAVKVLKPETAVTPEAFHRFRREALVTSGLRHPGIVQVIDFNQAPDGSPYLVMEYLEGAELSQVIAREAPMPLARVVEIVQQIASALGAAHKQGIVHRDLKPQNVFVLPLDDGRELVKVVDFGISKVQALSLKLTNESALLGTPQYMAPEHVINKGELDGRADEFALAAIAYEMLTGRCAFQGETVMSLVYQIVNTDPPPVAAFNPTIDAEAERVLRRALAKAPGARFATIQEFGSALAGAAGLPATSARPSNPAAAPIAPPGSSVTPRADDVRFSTTLQASTGQVRAGARATSRSKTIAVAGVLGVAALGAVVVGVVRRPYLPARGSAPASAPAAAPAPHPDPLPAKRGEGNEKRGEGNEKRAEGNEKLGEGNEGNDGENAAAAAEHPAAGPPSQTATRRRSGGKRGKRGASTTATGGAPAPRAREVLIDDL